MMRVLKMRISMMRTEIANMAAVSVCMVRVTRAQTTHLRALMNLRVMTASQIMIQTADQSYVL